jgi:hypothetical protein
LDDHPSACEHVRQPRLGFLALFAGLAVVLLTKLLAA